MVKNYWWWVAYMNLMSAPVPLVLIGFLNWVGHGPRGFWDRVLGTNPFKVLVVLVKEDYPINLLSGGTSTE